MATERQNPYSNFNFSVAVEGLGEVGSFSEVSGLDSESTPIEYREGMDPTNAPRKVVGIERYPNVICRRGIAGNLKLWEWRREILEGSHAKPPGRKVTVTLLDETRTVAAMTWTLRGAWPTKITGPSLNAKGNEIAIESVELAVERLEIG